VWATDEWQAAHPTIVCVPTYPETILDDHGSYTTTEYVELTRRLIDSVTSTYAVDASRIYGTGQSMGCMTTLILASEYPDLYAGCMFVDGQWDVSVLGGLEGQRFVYFAAEDDQSAFSGMSEVKEMFDNDAAPYATAQWDGNWSNDELSAAANELFSQGQDANFVSWASGTIDASSGGMMGGPNGGDGAAGGMNGGMMGGDGAEGGMGPGGAGGMNGGMMGGDNADGGDGAEGGMGPGGAGGGMMGGASYHMASFDYAYRCIAAMEWLFQE
jgi:pimeloyl-ACP methyl ester carboxylesterase